MAMWLDELNLVNVNNGKRLVKADISSDDTPSSFPEDGTNIEGLSANDTLAKGSTIYVIANGSLYMMDSAKNWVQQ